MATRRKFDASALGARARGASEGLARKDRRREVEAAREIEARSTWPLDRIEPRPSGNTRPLSAEHVVALAESIEALGLIEPLVVDIRGRLLAGGHRLAACRLLDPREDFRDAAVSEVLDLAPARGRAELGARVEALRSGGVFDPAAVPVRVFDFDALEFPERALLVETSENTQRRDYTRAQVVRLYQRLIEAGYTDKRGKPRKGEKAARPVLATVIGRSVRTVRRVLSEAPEAVNRTNAGLGEGLKAARALGRALDRLGGAKVGTGSSELDGFLVWAESVGLKERVDLLVSSMAEES